MKKFAYNLLIHLPIIGPIIRMKTQVMFCSPGTADGFFNEQVKLIKEYQKKHPDIVVTKQLLKKLITKQKPK